MNSIFFALPRSIRAAKGGVNRAIPQHPLFKGGLLLEAVVTLALLAIFLGFIFQKQNQQRKQLDEVNTAEAIKVVSNSLKQYLAENQALYPDDGTYELAAGDAEFSKFLPTNFSFGNFKAIIKRDNDKFSGLVLTDQTDAKGRPYTNVSAARIAAMLGSSGGFIKANETLATGTMGLWKLDMAGYFADPEKEAPVRIVAAVDMEQDRVADLENSLDDLKGKALFRVKVDGMPDANKMETDIDMSGNSLVDLAFLKYRENGIVKDGFIIDAKSGTISLAKQMAPLAVSSNTDAAENTAVVSGNIPGSPYSLDLAGTSVMKDLRLENLGGVELSEVIGNYQLRTVHRDVGNGAFVPAPGFKVDGTELKRDAGQRTCPVGYAPALSVTGKGMTPGQSKTTSAAVPQNECTFQADAADTCQITVTASCPSGYSMSGTQCQKTESQVASSSYSCPSGGTLSGTTCKQTTSYSATIFIPT